MNRLTTLCAALSAVVYTAPQTPGTTVQINPQQIYQSFDGVGVAEAFQRSLVLYELDTPSQNLALDYLFSRTKGAGFTILRNGLGSSPDDPFDLMKSIAPAAPPSNSSQVLNPSDPLLLRNTDSGFIQLNYIPLPRQDEYQLWLSHQAIERGVKSIYADAWSADGYMKTTGELSHLSLSVTANRFRRHRFQRRLPLRYD